jgi:hypothetical protein
MTDSDISELRYEISSLNTHLADLVRSIGDLDERLNSIGGKLSSFWLDFFLRAALCVALGFILVLIILAIKHW